MIDTLMETVVEASSREDAQQARHAATMVQNALAHVGIAQQELKGAPPSKRQALTLGAMLVYSLYDHKAADLLRKMSGISLTGIAMLAESARSAGADREATNLIRDLDSKLRRQ